MIFSKKHIKYLFYRGLSISFIAIGVNHIILDFNWFRALLFLIIGFTFTALNAQKSSVEKELECFKKVSLFFREFFSLSILISFAITILSLYRWLIGESYTLELLAVSSALFISFSLVYIYLCKRSL